MKYLLFILLSAGMTMSATAQTTPEDSVKAAVRLLFDGMLRSDSAMIVSAFADSAILQSAAEGPDGKVRVEGESVKAFAGFVARVAKGDADERIQFETIRIDGPLAVVWAPYTFYYKGKLHHCGADSFQLVRLNGKWKIQYLIDTRRKDCK
ncbi:MAG: DUF4440 domain-containing protein [Bacteroidetes bacterium]|nr:DUF4440 domain-containing protein [Bacteroidota bacterium]